MNKKYSSCLIFFLITSITYCQEIINDQSLTLTNNPLSQKQEEEDLINDPYLMAMIDYYLKEQAPIENSVSNRTLSTVQKLPTLKHSRKYHCKKCNVWITAKSTHLKSVRHASIVRAPSESLSCCPLCQKTLLPNKRSLYFHMHRFHKK